MGMFNSDTESRSQYRQIAFRPVNFSVFEIRIVLCVFFVVLCAMIFFFLSLMFPLKHFNIPGKFGKYLQMIHRTSMFVWYSIIYDMKDELFMP